MPDRNPQTARFLPLAPAVLEILLALAEGDCHGYVLMQEVERRSEGHIRLLPGTLYRMMDHQLSDGIIVEPARRPAASNDDERRRYYRLTRLGHRVACAEAERLANVLRAARARRLLGRTERAS